MWYWTDTQAVMMPRCIHVPKFHDPIAQIPWRGMEGWLDTHSAATVRPMAADALERVLEICENSDTQRVQQSSETLHLMILSAGFEV